MTDSQYCAHLWLSRMWDADIEINQLILRREKVLASMSGIGHYDAELIPSMTGENGSESKNIEYSILSEKIEKKESEMSFENVRTMEVISKVENSMLQGMLTARYINRLTWTEVGNLYNYGKTQVYEKYRLEALDQVYQNIPEEERWTS